MKTNNQSQLTRIAVPYYGTLSSPPSGLSRVFFLAEVNLETGAIDNLSLQVWNPKKESNLSYWLRKLKVDGVICSDNSSPYGVAFDTESVWVQWNQKGEVHEVIERWVRSKPKITYESPSDSDVPCFLKPAWQLS